MKLFGLAGWSGSGKTTLVVKLLPLLIRRGVRVSTMKHAHHGFDVDQRGKDSFAHREAGATEVLVSSANRWALMHENRGMPEARLEDLVRHMTPVDLLIVEGFKAHAHDKLEIYRHANGKPLMAPGDPYIVAVASDVPIGPIGGGRDRPNLDLNDVEGIAQFILRHCQLEKAA
ncbi:MAG: molybdopterin-guanine dinucleotide biosynthesis protein B [Alphaproteobacteria bacterium]|nr:molybdopterin-guanine dinucleotide biosynthesis protein B [Alphaproteobacteria bacterium]